MYAFYTWERWLHFDQWKTPVTLYNFTVMGDKVLTLSLGKEAFSDYKEGEYAYIYCPHVSWLWKHPFTICSAPFESTIQFSIMLVGNIVGQLKYVIIYKNSISKANPIVN